MTKIALPYNLANVPRTDQGEIIPKGFYLGEIARLAEIKAKVDKGTGDQLLVAIAIKDAEVDANKPYIGATIIDTISLLPQVAWKVGQFSDAVLGRKVSGESLDTDEHVGRPVAVRVYSEEWEGSPRMRVERYLPVTTWRKGAKPAASKPAAQASPPAAPAGNGTQPALPPAGGADDDPDVNLA